MYEPPFIIESDVEYTADSFHGYVGTLEWVRRFAGARHAEFLERLRADVERRWPDGFRERSAEHVHLARRPG